jgi:hypothetical protein
MYVLGLFLDWDSYSKSRTKNLKKVNILLWNMVLQWLRILINIKRWWQLGSTIVSLIELQYRKSLIYKETIRHLYIFVDWKELAISIWMVVYSALCRETIAERKTKKVLVYVEKNGLSKNPLKRRNKRKEKDNALLSLRKSTFTISYCQTIIRTIE